MCRNFHRYHFSINKHTKKEVSPATPATISTVCSRSRGPCSSCSASPSATFPGVAATSRELNGDSTSDDTSVSRFPLLVLTAMRSDASVSAGSNGAHDMRHLLPCLARHRYRRQHHRVQVEKRLADRLRQSCRQVQNPPFIFPPQPYFPATAVPRYPAGVRSATTFSTTRSIFLVFLGKSVTGFHSVARPRGRVAENSPFLHSSDTLTPGSTFCPSSSGSPLPAPPSSSHQSSPRERNARVSRQLPRRRQRAKLKQPQIRSRIAVREETPDQIQPVLWHAQFPQRNALDRGALRLIFPLFLPDVCDGFPALFSSPFPRRVFPAKIPPMASRVKRLSFPTVSLIPRR